MAAEGTLVDLAVLQAVERHAHVLELDDHLDRAPAHVLDRVLVAEVVGALDRVVHVPVPVVLGRVGERRGDAALRGDGVRAGRKHLREHRDPQVGARELERRAHAGAARADHDGVEFADRGCRCSSPENLDRPAHIAGEQEHRRAPAARDAGRRASHSPSGCRAPRPRHARRGSPRRAASRPASSPARRAPSTPRTSKALSRRSRQAPEPCRAP